MTTRKKCLSAFSNIFKQIWMLLNFMVIKRCMSNFVYHNFEVQFPFFNQTINFKLSLTIWLAFGDYSGYWETTFSMSWLAGFCRQWAVLGSSAWHSARPPGNYTRVDPSAWHLKSIKYVIRKPPQIFFFF